MHLSHLINVITRYTKYLHIIKILLQRFFFAIHENESVHLKGAPSIQQVHSKEMYLFLAMFILEAGRQRHLAVSEVAHIHLHTELLRQHHIDDSRVRVRESWAQVSCKNGGDKYQIATKS